MLITFKRLILELTRQCNMRCAHCMRGEPEDKTIGTSILERLFREVRHIEHLGLTGGEPALVPEQIECIVHLAKRWGCTIGHYYYDHVLVPMPGVTLKNFISEVRR